MPSDPLHDRVQSYLRGLCVDIPHRRLGSAGNRAATDYVAGEFSALGFQVEQPEFPCLDWRTEGAGLSASGESYDVKVAPYSLGVTGSAPLTVASTIADLEAPAASGQVLLLAGALTREMLMPHEYPFYYPDEHRRLRALIEARQPLALVAATRRCAETAGALDPFPLIEDGNLSIPNLYTTAEEGVRLAARAGETVALDVRAWRTPSTGRNVIVATEPRERRMVVCAHIDTHQDTPGALDNAAGVVVLLLLAEMLRDYAGGVEVELAVLNGEDDYSAAGELDYLRRNVGRLSEIALAVNLDALGYREGHTAWSSYECPDELVSTVRQAFSAWPGLAEGPFWPQSDHMVFAMNGVPALAFTSEALMEVEGRFAHTPADVPALVDPAKLVEAARALMGLVEALSV